MSFTNFLAAELLDHIFTDAAYAPPTTLHIGLSTTTPAEDGTGVTEPVGNGYARVPIVAADMNAATLADPSVKSNGNVLTFPQATADWAAGANMTHWVLYDAVSAGNLLASAALTTPRAVLNGDTATIPAGSMQVTLD